MQYDEMLGLLTRPWELETAPGVRLFEFELLFWGLVILLTVALVRYRPKLMEKAEVRFYEISQYKRFWLVAFVLAVIVARLALVHWIPVPVAFVHDECSYLLASDTFAHGRLTNPPSPMWVHFESFHINVVPTYQSMYPPAQGLAMAAGQLLTGVPWFGVLLSTALMCGAIYWMLLGWLPAPWAWLGGAFACARFGIFSYWVNTYFGGSVAALGGALVLGAFIRFRRKPSVPMGLVLAAGLLILANSRPLEGLLFSAPLVLAALYSLIQGLRSGQVTWGGAARVVLPASALLVAGGAWMLFYNWRGTGHPLLMPYQVNFEMYHITKPFLFQKPNPVPHYRHISMRALYALAEMPSLVLSRVDLGALVQRKVRVYYGYFIWPLSLLIAPCLYAMWRSEMRAVLVSTGLLTANMLAQVWVPQPHYAAPAAGAIILAALFSMRHFRSSGSAYAVWGSRALAGFMAVWMLSPVADAMQNPFRMLPSIFWPQPSEYKVDTFPLQYRRAAIEHDLNLRSGKQLVIVHYPYRYVPWNEWVYNEADIDRAHIVWARDMGYLKNQELIAYYPDRQVWYVDRGDPTTPLHPYDEVAGPFKLAFANPAPNANAPVLADFAKPVAGLKVKPVSAEVTTPDSSGSH